MLAMCDFLGELQLRYRAILFDMDGTLVPMDTDDFAKAYLKKASKRFIPFGIDPMAVMNMVLTGTDAMVKNDGSITNKELFWKTAVGKLPMDLKQVDEIFTDFYRNEFKEVREETGANSLAREAVRLAHEHADLVILATNPLFPMIAQEERMSWVGLKPSDFDYVSSYEEDCFCKPNPAYYTAICEKFDIDPRECLMIGNDTGEDMAPATALGMDGYLVTDTVIEREEAPWQGARGSFAELVAMLQTL